MEFLLGHTRIPFRRFWRSLFFAVDSEGRRCAKYERRRNRVGVGLGIGLAGLVIWGGFAWQAGRRNASDVSGELAWDAHDLEPIDRELDASLKKSPLADAPDLVPLHDRLAPANNEELSFTPPEVILQTQSTALDEGPSLLLTHSTPDTADQRVPANRPKAADSAPVGARLLGIIEEIPEDATTSPPRQNRRGTRPVTGPAIVPGNPAP